MLGTMRSHDQWNTTIYSNDDRYRGVKNLRTLVFMNVADMAERGLGEMALVDITSIGRDGSRRSVYGYRALAYDIPRGNAAGYMPELNVLIPVAEASAGGNGHTNGNGNGHATPVLKPLNLGATRVSFEVSADSPSCADCGSIMVRNGSCYKCLNCGNSMGCS